MAESQQNMLLQNPSHRQSGMMPANKQAKTVESIPLQINKERLTFSVSSDVDGQGLRKMSQNEPSHLADLTTHSIDNLNMQLQAENLNSQLQQSLSSKRFIPISGISEADHTLPALAASPPCSGRVCCLIHHSRARAACGCSVSGRVSP